MTKRISALAAVVVLSGALLAAPAAAQGVNVLKSVSFQKTDTGINVAIMIDGDFLYQAQTLANPTRLVLDLSPLARIDAQPYTEVGQAGLTSIRTGQFAAMIARVVLDFAGDVPGYDVAKTDGGLLVRVAPELKAAKPAEQAPVQAPVQTPPAVREQPVAKTKPAETVETSEAAEAPDLFANTMIGFTYGSHLVPDTSYQEIYGTDAKMIPGFSLSRTLLRAGGFSVDVEGGIRFYSKTGASVGDAEAATFKMTPISVAARLNYQWKFVQVFAGYGLDWTSFTETSTIETTTGNASGHHYTAGVYLIPPVLDGMLRVKLYYKFTKMPATANGITIELGGNEYGVGLSFGFNILKQGVLSF